MIDNQASPDGEHMAMPNGATLAEKPELSIAGTGSDMPREEYQPPSVAGSESNLLMTEFGIGEDFVNAAQEWAPEIGGRSAADLAEIDGRDKVIATDELQHLWGTEYAANFKRINSFLEQRLTPSDRELLEVARDRDGTAILNKSGTLQKLLIAANRVESVGLRGSADQQINQIERLMREDRRAYDQDEALQARYRELLTKRHD